MSTSRQQEGPESGIPIASLSKGVCKAFNPYLHDADRYQAAALRRWQPRLQRGRQQEGHNSSGQISLLLLFEIWNFV